MSTKYDTRYCPCGCGNDNERIENLTGGTEKDVEWARKKFGNKRYCMQEGTGYIALMTPKEAKKQNSKPIEEFGLEVFLDDAETEHDKWAATSLYRMMTMCNAWANSKDNRIDK